MSSSNASRQRFGGRGVAAFVLVGLACAAGAVWSLLRPRAPVLVFVEEREQNVGSAAASTSADCSLSGMRLMLHCELFQTGVEVSLRGDVRLTFKEFVPENFSDAVIQTAPGTTAGTHEQVVDHEVSFSPVAFASRGSHELYVTGVPRPLDDNWQRAGSVVEVWFIDAPDGAPYAVRQKSSLPIGTPAPHSTLEAHVKGGTYIVAGQRAAPRVRKRLVANVPFHVNGLEVDPDGRYLVLLAGTEGKLYRINLVPAVGAPVVILDSAARPELVAARGVSAFLFDDSTKRFFIECRLSKTIVLPDANNDGIFETPEVFTAAALDASPLGDYDFLLENYHTYAPVDLFR